MVHSRIREIRKQKGLTLQEVAGRCGTTAQTIGRLETGMRTLSLDWVNRIAKALGVPRQAIVFAIDQPRLVPSEGCESVAVRATTEDAELTVVPRFDTDFASVVRSSFERQGFMAHIGAVLISVTPGRCEVGLDHRDDLTQQHGFIHGGVVGAIIHTAMG
ncbi:MAG: helix-turn-helix domain-containing protein [Proteobacteria bacterium]|nr:helix-turn-helix domain-containing protein [Pseudomonadota bacterium]